MCVPFDYVGQMAKGVDQISKTHTIHLLSTSTLSSIYMKYNKLINHRMLLHLSELINLPKKYCNL